MERTEGEREKLKVQGKKGRDKRVIKTRLGENEQTIPSKYSI